MLYKLWVPLVIATLLLQACGTEKTKELAQNENYRYVEIEECTIPIPKKFEELKVGDVYIYRFSYHPNIQNFMKINISKNRVDDYIDNKNTIMQNKGTKLISDFKRNHFKIIKWNIVNPIHDEDNYVLFGLKTNINLINRSEKELNYLLDYCKKTWKLDKGEENVI